MRVISKGIYKKRSIGSVSFQSIRRFSGYIIIFIASLPSMVYSNESESHRNKISLSDFDNEQALAYSQSVIGKTIADYQLTDQNGNTVNIANYYIEKPAIVSFIYTSCHHTCPVLTTNLHKTVEIAQQALGKDSFTVLTIGFDAGIDTPQRMKSFAAERGINDRNWHFLSADTETIENITRDMGFIFFTSAKGFDHLAQTTIIDRKGRVYRQIYGASFPPPALIEPLKEIMYEGGNFLPTNISEWINNIRLFCTIYDPSSGRYGFDYSIFIALITGFISLGALLLFLVHLWRTNRTS